jgi:light-regulated signal transduction histidine kinase (bacteriophytochrome)
MLTEAIEKLVPDARGEIDRILQARFVPEAADGAARSGKPLWGVHRDGKAVPLEVEVTRVRRRKAPYALVSIVDLSERQRWADDVSRLNLELSRTIDDLKGANREMEAFAYSVSHDLRAPLRAIDGYTRLFVDQHGEGVATEGRRLLDVVCANARQMGNLIDDLLALSRLGRRELAVTSVDLMGSAQTIVRQLQESSPERTVRVEIGELPRAVGDAGMLHQVFSNLIGNAWKFTSRTPDAAITIEAARRNGEIVYSIRDNGAGFNDAYADKLFGVFQRLHASDEFEGNGIGLVIVQRIVERHGGRVWAEGQVQKGAAFHFTLGTPSVTEVCDAR